MTWLLIEMLLKYETIIRELISKMEREGYEGSFASARVCQDLILQAIASSTLSSHVTIKNGYSTG